LYPVFSIDIITGVQQAAQRVRKVRALEAEALARFFHGLSDPDRVRILEYLLDGPKTAGEIVRHLGRPQSSVAAHVTCLRFCGYCEARREGRNVVYEIIDPNVRRIVQMARRYLRRNDERILACRVIAAERGR
jgi:DNA-binding transcriptional ArsR family regulator